ncbi:hypothetical protein [Azorhizobium oxalatiphilum]|nr:hypothetical protein [Azorhizobium oxalatiphilum]
MSGFERRLSGRSMDRSTERPTGRATGLGPQRFRLDLRCESCGVQTQRILSMPLSGGSPYSPAGLACSPLFKREPFTCKRCAGESAHLMCATPLPMVAEAA